MSQIIVCLKKYAKDSQMVYYFRLEFEVQILNQPMNAQLSHAASIRPK